MSIFQIISDWRQEERGSENRKYFYSFDEVPNVLSGRYCFVIGRKGTGKTSIAEHIKSVDQHDTFVQKLTFRSFPFNRLYALKDENFTHDSQYITIWKYVIYCAVCRLMTQNRNLDSQAIADLSEFFTQDLETALSDEIVRLTDPNVSVKILSVGAGFGRKRTLSANPFHLSDRVKILEGIIRDNIDHANYYILFDELDEDFNAPSDVESGSQYLRLIVGLFKAISEVRTALEDTNVRPILFLRDDIFESIKFGDRGKWRDDMLTLSWTKERLRNLIVHRIDQAIGNDPHLNAERDAWHKLFEDEPVKSGRRKQRRRSPFDHMVRQTFMRPRDAIVYVRECARIAESSGIQRVTPAELRDADVKYSEYLKGEIVDELHAVFPEIDEIFNLLSWFERGEFKHDAFKKFYETNRADLPAFETAINHLAKYSVVGRMVNTRPVYHYNSGNTPPMPLGPGDIICVHHGLRKALNLHR